MKNFKEMSFLGQWYHRRLMQTLNYLICLVKKFLGHKCADRRYFVLSTFQTHSLRFFVILGEDITNGEVVKAYDPCHRRTPIVVHTCKRLHLFYSALHLKLKKPNYSGSLCLQRLDEVLSKSDSRQFMQRYKFSGFT